MNEDDKPGLSPDAKALTEKVAIWLVLALTGWLVLLLMAIGTVKVWQWLF